MNDPEQLASLEGQQYLVLRPTGEVSSIYRETQKELLDTLSHPVTHPHTEHVTLRGFYEPERRDELATLLRAWAAQQGPIEVTVNRIDTFPAPWQIVLMRLERTASLVRAYTTLTNALQATDYRRLDELSIDDWVFHLSVIYGKTLTPDAWAELERTSRRDVPERPATVIREAEFVWYSDGVENYEVIPLR